MSRTRMSLSAIAICLSFLARTAVAQTWADGSGSGHPTSVVASYSPAPAPTAPSIRQPGNWDDVLDGTLLARVWNRLADLRRPTPPVVLSSRSAARVRDRRPSR
jgi:hypothetical protein